MARWKLKIEKGCKVRLRQDVSTRGGTVFRAGLVMRVDFFETRRVDLSVRVRGKRHIIRLEKAHIDYYLELVEPAPANQKEEC